MNRMRYAYMVLCLVAVCACNGKQSSATQQNQVKEKRTFTMVEIPSMIAEPEKRIDYAVKHYWDKFDFTDTTYVHLPDVTEQAFTNYIAFLVRSTPEVAAASIKGMLKKAEVDSTVYAYFTNMYEKYLYDPNAPMRNEELYIYVLESILSSSLVDDVHKIRPAHLLELALKNRVGAKAADFTYTLANGQTGRMYQLKADYLLLFFYNPDCEACKELTEQLTKSLFIKKMMQENRLKVLALYPDEDIKLWKMHLGHIPNTWIVGYDAAAVLKNEEIYDLKAIPCIYLLDKDKNVLLKDASYNQLVDYFSRINQ